MTQNLKKTKALLRYFALSLILLLNFQIQAHAASIVAVCSNSNLSPANCPNSKLFSPTYQVSGGEADFRYKIDRGSIGDLGETEARTLAENMLTLWEDQSSLVFNRKGDGLLDEDIDSSNYTSILESNSALGFSPVVWDDDGQITEDLFGFGSSDSVLGFAGPSFFSISGSSNINSIAESQSVFNGILFRGSNTQETSSEILSTFQTTILHEFAHMFGIDHTQGGNIDGYNSFQGDFTDIPVMFPAAANPNVELLQDDIAAVKIAYPLSSDANSFGTIAGTLTQGGSPVLGASVVAFRLDDSNPRLNAVASPSDVDGKGNGSFTIPGLLPGTYIVKAEAIDETFTSGSAVGIHEPISPNLINTGFYNGDNQSIIESSDLSAGQSRAETITVNAGSNTTIDFNLSATSTSNPDDNSGGSDSGDDSNAEEASFELSGGVFRNSVFLKFNKTKKKKFKITNLLGGERNLMFTSDHPNLVSFRPSSQISFSKARRKARVIIASFNDFIDEFPDLESEGAEVRITVTDLDTGYVDNGNTLLLF